MGIRTGKGRAEERGLEGAGDGDRDDGDGCKKGLGHSKDRCFCRRYRQLARESAIAGGGEGKS